MGEGSEGSGAGDGDGTTGDAWDDDNISGLWGWLDGIVSGLETVWQAITSLPEKIADSVKDIFVPDNEYIETQFDGFLNEMKMKWGFSDSFMHGLFDNETAVTDIKSDYTIPGVGSFKLTMFDSSFFVQGITYFRPFIRGFLVLMMMLYHIKQLIGFFGYDAGVVTGRTEHIKSARENQ